MPVDRRTVFLAAHDRLVIRSTALLERLAARPRLPVSADYWEVPEAGSRR